MIDIKGMRSGKLVACVPTEQRNSKGFVLWECKCDCGNTCLAPSYSIRTQKKKSCGCLQTEIVTFRNKARGIYSKKVHEERLFRIWSGIYARTHYKSQVSYANYGGRGIKMCEQWENDYFAFKKWALTNGYNDNLTIERRNVDGNYEPSNCTWISRSEQSKNQRSNIVITYDDETHIASEWADIMGISHSCIYKRIMRNSPTEKILKEWIAKKQGEQDGR